MKENIFFGVPVIGFMFVSAIMAQTGPATVALPLNNVAGGKLNIDGLFYETAGGGQIFRPQLTASPKKPAPLEAKAKMPGGHTVKLSIISKGQNFSLSLTAALNTNIKKWELAIEAINLQWQK